MQKCDAEVAGVVVAAAVVVAGVTDDERFETPFGVVVVFSRLLVAR
jgi:hypothetical protein